VKQSREKHCKGVKVNHLAVLFAHFPFWTGHILYISIVNFKILGKGGKPGEIQPSSRLFLFFFAGPECFCSFLPSHPTYMGSVEQSVEHRSSNPNLNLVCSLTFYDSVSSPVKWGHWSTSPLGLCLRSTEIALMDHCKDVSRRTTKKTRGPVPCLPVTIHIDCGVPPLWDRSPIMTTVEFPNDIQEDGFEREWAWFQGIDLYPWFFCLRVMPTMQGHYELCCLLGVGHDSQVSTVPAQSTCTHLHTTASILCTLLTLLPKTLPWLPLAM
jgi:hypothetical protein